MTTNPELEQEARELHDRIFGAITDEEWSKCKDNWMMPYELEWLRKTVKQNEPKH